MEAQKTITFLLLFISRTSRPLRVSPDPFCIVVPLAFLLQHLLEIYFFS